MDREFLDGYALCILTWNDSPDRYISLSLYTKMRINKFKCRFCNKEVDINRGCGCSKSVKGINLWDKHKRETEKRTQKNRAKK